MSSRLKRAVCRFFGIKRRLARDLVRDGDYVQLTHGFYGPLRLMAGDQFIGGCVHDGKSLFERDLAAVFRREIRGGRTVLDVGANVGLHSIVMAKHLRRRGRGGRVIALEPHPEIAALTRANCLLYPEVELIARAASNQATAFTMPKVLHSDNPGGVGFVADGELRVESVTIDSLNLQDVEFMKIDVEGHEPEAIRGAEETIRRCRPTMVVEIMGGHHRQTAPPEIVAEIERRVRYIGELGYDVQRISMHDYLCRPR